MTSYFHSLIPFLPLFCSCQFRSLDSIQLLFSQAHILVAWCLEIRLTLLNWTLARTTQKTYPFYCWEVVFTVLYIAMDAIRLLLGYSFTRECLLRRCLTMNVYSDYTIQVLRRHATIHLHSDIYLIWHIASQGDKRSPYKVFVGKPEGKRLLERPWRR
jgi:hypothetical protein